MIAGTSFVFPFPSSPSEMIRATAQIVSFDVTLIAASAKFRWQNRLPASSAPRPAIPLYQSCCSVMRSIITRFPKNLGERNVHFLPRRKAAAPVNPFSFTHRHWGSGRSQFSAFEMLHFRKTLPSICRLIDKGKNGSISIYGGERIALTARVGKGDKSTGRKFLKFRQLQIFLNVFAATERASLTIQKPHRYYSYI